MNEKRLLSDYTFLSEQEFRTALSKIDWKNWENNPEKDRILAELKLKNGVHINVDIDTDEKPQITFKTQFEQKEKLSFDSLQAVAGGITYGYRGNTRRTRRR